VPPNCKVHYQFCLSVLHSHFLTGVYKLQNANTTEKLEAAFFGIVSVQRIFSLQSLTSWFQYSTVFESHTKNDNWTRPLEEFNWLPEVDLGELEEPEPPLFYQADSEEIDLFLDSTPDVKQEVTENAVSNPDTASTEATTSLSLIGAWSGTYTHRRSQQSAGLTSFTITEQSTEGTLGGSGVDVEGAFVLYGTIKDDKVDFQKEYTATNTQWRYIGTLNTETGSIFGQWGPLWMEVEAAPPSAVEGGTPFNRPEENTGAGSVEDQPPIEQVPPCDIEITVEGPAPGDEKAEERCDGDGGNGGEDDDRVSLAGSARSSVKTDATEAFAGGSFTLVRRPVDYFLYRPSDAEIEESRPKSLWKMVRNAAKQWYRSHHLIWDALRERRDQRNRYVELFLKEEEEGRLYNDEAVEWAKLIRQAHPNDLRLWRAIARYKQHRTPRHTYVQITNY
jgi:hypothetical protein